MAGFQIPGLGNAKPDEKLPPLPPGQALASPVAADPGPSHNSRDAENPEATVHDAGHPDVPAESINHENIPANGTPESHPRPSDVVDRGCEPMALDWPPSPSKPPSLTGALEAAIGGIDNHGSDRAFSQAPSAQVRLASEDQPSAMNQDEQPDQPEWEADSSPYESSSTSSSDDDSDDDSDKEEYSSLDVRETARLLMQAEAGSDDEGDRAGKSASGAAAMRTKNEIPDEAVPRPNITITPDMKIEELGTVEHVVDNMVLIKAFTPGEYQVLDSGSVLCNTDRTVLGVVAETIGKVVQPMYTVRFNSPEEVVELGIHVGIKVFYPVDHATFVFTEPLKSIKGSDASNIHDEEVGDDEMEFSDDEKEAEYKRSLKEKKRKRTAARGGAAVRHEPHPLRRELGPRGELNYDDGASKDDEDGPYVPLARPPGFGTGFASQEIHEPPQSGSWRARDRGDPGRGAVRGRGAGGPKRGRRAPMDGPSLLSQASSSYQQTHPHPVKFDVQPQSSAPPSLPNFKPQASIWPPPPPPPGTQPQVPIAPLPPPGWPRSTQGQGQVPDGTMDPALLAALMAHLQGQQQWQPPGR